MISIEAVRGGIHVLCEKPLVSNLDDAELIRREVEREKVRFMVGFNYRFLPNHVMARRFAHDGRIGRPIFIRGQSVTAGAYRADIPPSHYAQESKKRIGALFDMESHLADLFIWQAG
jgi:predicted dehydrogenase